MENFPHKKKNKKKFSIVLNKFTFALFQRKLKHEREKKKSISSQFDWTNFVSKSITIKNVILIE